QRAITGLGESRAGAGEGGGDGCGCSVRAVNGDAGRAHVQRAAGGEGDVSLLDVDPADRLRAADGDGVRPDGIGTGGEGGGVAGDPRTDDSEPAVVIAGGLVVPEVVDTPRPRGRGP